MSWILDARNSHQKNEVGGMTGCHKHTLTHSGLVNWAFVALESLEIRCLAWREQHHRALCEKNLRVTLVQGVNLSIPLGSFKEHSDDVDTILWSLGIFLICNDRIIESKEIDSNTILSGIVLFRTGQETLSEEESSDPKYFRKSLISPFLEPLKSCQEVLHVPSEGL